MGVPKAVLQPGYQRSHVEDVEFRPGENALHSLAAAESSLQPDHVLGHALLETKAVMRQELRVSSPEAGGSTNDLSRFGLQIGWFLIFLVSVGLIAAHALLTSQLGPSRSKGDTHKEWQSKHPYRKYAAALQGIGDSGYWLSASTLVVGVGNALMFAVWTEHEYLQNSGFKTMRTLHCFLAVLSIAFFGLTMVARVALSPEFPEWRKENNIHVRYVLSDGLLHFEMVCWALSLVSVALTMLYGKPCGANLLWVFCARILESWHRGGMGLGFRSMRTIISEDGYLLFTSSVLGCVVWLVMSGLYFNSARLLAAPWNAMTLAEDGGTTGEELEEMQPFGDDPRWEAAIFKMDQIDGVDMPWNRFNCITSTMFYVLINLMKEHPLAGVYTTFWTRVWVCVSCFLAVPIFAIPVSILQYALCKPNAEKTDVEEFIELEGRVTLADDQMPRFVGICILVWLSCMSYFSWTANKWDHGLWFGLESSRMTDGRYASFDAVFTALFLADMLARLRTEQAYWSAWGLAIIDFLAWVPGLLRILAYLICNVGEQNFALQWLSAMAVLRVFKLERFFGTFEILGKVAYAKRSLLSATAVLAFTVWCLFAAMLYVTEGQNQRNPDEEMQETYGSFFRSLWAEVINLHGEFPWADYTPWGRAIETHVAFFAIILFALPTVILSDGLMEYISATDPAHDSDVERRPWWEKCRPPHGTRPRLLYDVCHEGWHSRRPAAFRIMRATSFGTTAIVTAVTLIGTLQPTSMCEETEIKGGECPRLKIIKGFGYFLDLPCVMFFFIEFFMRSAATGFWRYPLSFCGVAHAASILGVCMSTLNPALRQKGFNPFGADVQFTAAVCIVPLRLLRVFTVETYVGVLNMLRVVLEANVWNFTRIAYATVSTWFTFSTLLYMFEHTPPVTDGDDDGDDDGLSMDRRYCSIFRALSIGIVHLFGDYPETGYNLASKFVHCVAIVVGIGILGAYMGLFVSGYMAIFEEDRRRQRSADESRRIRMVTKVVIMWQRLHRRARQRAALVAAGDQAGLLALPPPPELRPLPFWNKLAIDIHYCRTPAGRVIHRFFKGVLLFSLLNTMFGSLPMVEKQKNNAWDVLITMVEVLCTLVFMAELAVAMSAGARARQSLFRIVDVISIVPGILLLLVWLFRSSSDSDKSTKGEASFEAFAMFRAIRILDFRVFQQEVTLIRRSFANSADQLVMPVCLTMQTWIITASLFWWFENAYKDDGHGGTQGQHENFTSVPSTMYFCCIFLLGEWCEVDFTYPGSRVCIFVVLCGVMLNSIPVGILAEGIQSAMIAADEEKRAMHQLLRNPAGALVGAAPAASEAPRDRHESEEAVDATPVRLLRPPAQPGQALAAVELGISRGAGNAAGGHDSVPGFCGSPGSAGKADVFEISMGTPLHRGF